MDMPSIPGRWKAGLSTWWTRSAIISGPLAKETPSARITNSSPPSRPTVSPARKMPSRRPATSCSNWSPALCPSESLESLKLSRSMNSAATGTPVRPRPHQHLLRSVENQLAVRQSRQRVVKGAVRQQGLELLPLGDVTDVGDVAGNRGPMRLVRDHRFYVAGSAVPSHHPELEGGRRRTRLKFSTEHSADGLEVIGMYEVGRDASDELLRRVVQEVHDRRGDVAKRALLAEDHRYVGRVLNQRTEPVLAQPQRAFGPLLLFHHRFVLLHDGSGHPDHEEEDEGSHHGQRGGLRLRQL